MGLFCVVLLDWEYEQGIAFVSCGDHGVIFTQFGLDRFHGFVFRLVVVLCVRRVMEF